MRFLTKIGDDRCYCNVTKFLPGSPAKLSGPMEDAEEALPPEFEYYLTDERGIRSHYLDEQITDEDNTRFLEEYEVTLIEHKYYWED